MMALISSIYSQPPTPKDIVSERERLRAETRALVCAHLRCAGVPHGWRQMALMLRGSHGGRLSMSAAYRALDDLREHCGLRRAIASWAEREKKGDRN